MLSIIITSFKEPNTIGKAIDSFLQQKTSINYELIVSAPDKETQEIVEIYAKKHKQVRLFKDPGKGKSHALNLLLPEVKGDIIMLSDGDVYVGENSIVPILDEFKDEKVGCVTGKPISSDSRKNKFGYWSHLLCNAAHRLRLKKARKNEFIECSGYLWAFKNRIIDKFPKGAAEDTIIPVLFYLKGFEVKYAPLSEVYVKFPTNFEDFLEQKNRTAKGHESLYKYVDINKVPRMKTFKNEFFGGFELFKFPKNIKECWWTFLLFPLRLYTWTSVFYQTKIKKEEYKDGWKRIESTK